MASLVILLVLTLALVAVSVFLGASIREKAGKNIYDKNNAWNFLMPVGVMIGIYLIAMTLKEVI
jgi:hypothetical protein